MEHLLFSTLVPVVPEDQPPPCTLSPRVSIWPKPNQSGDPHLPKTKKRFVFHVGLCPKSDQ